MEGRSSQACVVIVVKMATEDDVCSSSNIPNKASLLIPIISYA